MDEIRGLCVLLMIFYHAFYTMSMLFHWELGTKLLVFFSPAEPFFAGLFILISGISSQLSHSNLIRGLKLLGVSLALTLVTYFIIPSELIVFGILHMLSVCMIVFGLGQKLWDRIPLILGLAVCAVLFLITMPVSDGYLGLPGTLAWKIPAGWYEFGWLWASIAPISFPPTISLCSLGSFSFSAAPILAAGPGTASSRTLPIVCGLHP